MCPCPVLRVAPGSMLSFSAVVLLDLHACSLTSLPQDFGRHLTSCRTLHLDHNHLTHLPASLRFATALEDLALHDNDLREVAEGELKPLCLWPCL